MPSRSPGTLTVVDAWMFQETGRSEVVIFWEDHGPLSGAVLRYSSIWREWRIIRMQLWCLNKETPLPVRRVLAHCELHRKTIWLGNGS